jgi:hypothetical protein
MKSPSSMRNGRFHTPKYSLYRGKLGKMEVLYTHFPKRLGLFPKIPQEKLKD